MKVFRAIFSRQWMLATLLVLAGGALCVRLGIWQLDRLEQRRAFNAHVESMWAAEPITLTGQPSEDLTAMEYRAVEVSGTYDFENQIALRNRYFQDEYGYHLLTPLLLDDGSAVLVDRGWIPADGNDSPADWRKYDQPGPVTLQGQIRLGRAKPDMGGVPDPTLTPGQTRLDFWNIVNLERIQGQVPYPLLNVFVQPEIDADDVEPPVPYQPEIELTEGSHHGYAFQWFTYATILVARVSFLCAQANEGAIMKFSLSSSFARLTLFVLVAVFLVTIGGRLVTLSDATEACTGWPLCQPQGVLGWMQLFHRASVAFASALMLYLLYRAWRDVRDHRVLLPLATITVILFFAQVFVGAMEVTRGFPLYLTVLHALTVVALWAGLLGLVAGFWFHGA